MKPDAFITQLLQGSAAYALSDAEKRIIEDSGLERFLFQKFASKKFRKFRMTDECIQRVTTALQQKLAAAQPLIVVYPQGGYKLWRLPSTPTVDWAEFFAISYVLSYLAPIAAAYEPGVELVFYMHAMLPELHDNLTTEEISAYVDSFEQLLVQFRAHLPKNVTVRILRDLDFYTREEYVAAAEASVALAAKEYPSWPESRKKDMARMARLNIKWDGREDWTKLSQKQQEEKMYLAALYESAATAKLTRIAETIKAPGTILLFNTGMRDFIGIGTTKASIAKYWVGFGVLQEREDTFLPLVLSPSQYEHMISAGTRRTVSSSVLPGINFEKLTILPGNATIF